MNEQLIDKLENKCQMIETLKRDLSEARKKLSQRRSSVENGTRQASLGTEPDKPDQKAEKLKDSVMKEPDMEPKQPSELGKIG